MHVDAPPSGFAPQNGHGPSGHGCAICMIVPWIVRGQGAVVFPVSLNVVPASSVISHAWM